MKRVLITGGNKGIGLATTKIFLEKGFEVLVLARNLEEVDSKVNKIEFDLTKYKKIPSLVKTIGKVDILVNNAGLMNALPYNDYPDSKMDQIIATNIQSPVALIRELAPEMIKQKFGRIVNMASIAGEIGHPDVWYGITKAGVINMTKSFAKQLGGHGITVNAIAPGPVETQMLDTIPEERKEAIKKAVYTGRFAKPEEVAQTIYWLSTDAPEYINGITIDINNGAFPR